MSFLNKQGVADRLETAAKERAKALQAEQKAQRDARYLARKAKAQKKR